MWNQNQQFPVILKHPRLTGSLTPGWHAENVCRIELKLNVPTEPVFHLFCIINYPSCTRTESCASDTVLNKIVPALRKLSVRLLEDFQGQLPCPGPVLFLCASARALRLRDRGHAGLHNQAGCTGCLLGAEYGPQVTKCGMEDAKKYKRVSERE